MSKITTIWNQPDKYQDISEVWSPSEEDGFRFLQENSKPGCYPKHVIISKHIGYMIMPGIYCFGRCDHSDFSPAIMTHEKNCDLIDLIFGLNFDSFQVARKSALLGYYLSDGHIFNHPTEFALMYLAVDEENIEILRKMKRTLGDGFWKKYILIENKAMDAKETQKEKEAPASPKIIAEPLKEASRQPFIENTAEELMSGLGIRDIRVGLKCIFSRRLPVTKYEYAYKSANKLVLIPYNKSNICRQEYDLCILEELTVRRTEALHCGILIDRDYFLIDCSVEKAKQVLTPEAYELFRKNNLFGLGESN